MEKIERKMEKLILNQHRIHCSGFHSIFRSDGGAHSCHGTHDGHHRNNHLLPNIAPASIHLGKWHLYELEWTVLICQTTCFHRVKNILAFQTALKFHQLLGIYAQQI